MKCKHWLKFNWQYVLAFFVPIVIMVAHCITRNVWLLGNNSILLGDAGFQYIYIFEELWHKVHDGDFSFFSWNAMCGFDFYLNMLYYTISSSTLIVLLLPIGCLENAIQFFMLMKWALLSVSSVYFFMNTHYNKLTTCKQFVAFSLGVGYALSGIFLNTLFLFNWMDTIILFPILLILIEKLVQNGTWRLYCVLLAIAIMCNFYIAFPICIFLTIWTMLQLLEIKGNRIKTFLLFVKASLLGGCIAMFAVIPCVANVGERYSDKQDTLAYVKSVRMTLGTLISKLWSFQTIDKNQMILSISAVLIVLFLCFVFIKFEKRIKYAKITLFLFLLLAVIFGGFSYIWQGFSIPHMLEPRFGFLFVFTIIIMVLDVVNYLEKIRLRHCAILCATWIVLFCYAFFNISEYGEVYIYLIHFMILAFVSIMLVLYVRKSITKKKFIILIFGICLCEIIGSAYIGLSLYKNNALNEYDQVEEIKQFIEEYEMEAGERFSAVKAGYNIGMLFDLPCTSGFVSYANGRFSKLMGELGMNVSNDSGFLYLGQSPLMNMLFNIRYGIGEDDRDYEGAIKEKELSSMNLYRMENIPGLGYMVDESVFDWKTNYNLPLLAQDEFVIKSLAIDELLFVPFKPKDLTCEVSYGTVENQVDDEKGTFQYTYNMVPGDEGSVIRYKVEKDGDYYFSLFSSYPIIVGIKIDDDFAYLSSASYVRRVIHIGKAKKNQVVEVISVPSEGTGEITLNGQFTFFDADVWDKTQKALMEDTMEIVEMKGDYVKGMVDAKQSGVLMTSIPYGKGFDVFVDGEKTECKAIADALIGVELEEGKHNVEFVYHTPYARIGALISLISVLVYILSFFVKKTQHRDNDFESAK